jgi:ABC-type multidrug transport system ATPase subunit
MINGDFAVDTPVQVYGLRKKFGQFTAVDNVSFHIPNNQCFGMLGPNGAGKTTTINMLTGLIPSTKGDANIGLKDLRTELSGVFENIGVCPQFDVCWPDLTIEEHLKFYARVKGVPEEFEMKEINKLVKDVGLEDAHKKKVTSKELSGGMRRRLSLAIALIGKPPVVFLDEPTTGLDPETKRNIWSLIDTFKRNRCVVLTTHSMDEADALCSRIGIMSHGRLRCIGENLHLKSIYGSGYRIDVRFDQDPANAIAFMKKMVPAATLDGGHSGGETLEFQLPTGSVKLSKVMRMLSGRPASAGILDYGIRQTSLEEVFLKIAREVRDWRRREIGVIVLFLFSLFLHGSELLLCFPPYCSAIVCFLYFSPQSEAAFDAQKNK